MHTHFPTPYPPHQHNAVPILYQYISACFQRRLLVETLPPVHRNIEQRRTGRLLFLDICHIVPCYGPNKDYN